MEKDIILKEYEEDPVHFCDLVNGILASGHLLLRPEQLQALPTELTWVKEVEDESGNTKKKTVQRFRDLTKKATVPDGQGYVIIAIQNQAKVDHGMPVRIMTEDALEYDAQRRHKGGKLQSGDKLMGVFTLVLYHGSGKWTGPMELHGMVQIPKDLEKLKPYLQNYRMIFASPQTVDPKNFHTGWREVFEILRIQSNRKKMDEYLHKNRERFQALPEDTNQLIFALTNQLEYYKKFKKQKGEEPEMCKAFDDNREEGRKEGREEGKKEGALNSEKNMVTMLFKNGVTFKQVANSVTLLTEEALQKIYAETMQRA